jgi:hypothetical protein
MACRRKSSHCLQSKSPSILECVNKNTFQIQIIYFSPQISQNKAVNIMIDILITAFFASPPQLLFDPIFCICLMVIFVLGCWNHYCFLEFYKALRIHYTLWLIKVDLIFYIKQKMRMRMTDFVLLSMPDFVTFNYFP